MQAEAGDTIVRGAAHRDMPSLMALRAAWRDAAITDAFAAEFADWFKREGSQRWWWIAEDSAGRARGMVNLKVFERMPSPDRSPSRWGYLANLFVDKPFRNQGVGTQLLTALLDPARDAGLVRVVLSPSEQSVSLYSRAGFAPADMLLVWQPETGSPLTPRTPSPPACR
jgi:GNAT superfamily N-acetyltransferase